MKIQSYSIVIVGAGLSGMMAARTLQAQGFEDLLLLESASVVGGRMASKTVGEGKFDYGAQFFTIRSMLLKEQANEWLKKGWIKHWFGEPYGRYTSVDGMCNLAVRISEGLPIKFEAEVCSIAKIKTGFELTLSSGQVIIAKSLILTAPAPQLKVMLEKEIALDYGELPYLLTQRFYPSLIAVFQLKNPTRWESSGHLDDGLPINIERMVDHQLKGISSIPTVSVYMRGPWSEEYYDKADDVIWPRIMEQVGKHIHLEDIIKKELIRWRYAEAASVVRKPFLDAGLIHPLLIAGDAYLSPQDQAGRTRLESAFLSGIAAGEELGRRLQDTVE
ncbi:NAD(P)/FAD-dependent oxidoreductase [Ammoniphilus sp. CFH 90114]|uniref:NAD(P)/FAD-dependent oxidoreductase n=1 Tax=Ammoniphilus sp. CFH 90114 TaxID=2493665 RepID=UPI00100EB030|nr:FAD-dependent oxidoreductase [Ammoniphilus sp. CFH 90114]RXT06502.1 hypothetical protein EIZ39_15665 [Ammoniphilus sp. CFH 90114]